MTSHWKRRRLLKSSGMAGAVLAAPAVIPSWAQAQTKELRVRADNNPAYMGKALIPEFLPEGYGVEWVDLGSKSMTALVAMQRKLLDYNSGGYTYLISSYAQGQDIVCVCGLAGGAQRVVARRDAGISELADVKGRKVATAKLSSTDIKFIAALATVGLDPENDVERIDVGSMAGVRASLDSGQADIGVFWEPAGAQIVVEDERFVTLDTLSEKSWSSQGGLYVLQSLIDSDPDEVQLVVSATVKSIEALREDQERWIEISQRESGLPRNVIDEAVLNCHLTYEIPLADQRLCATWMRDLGLMDRDVSDEIEQAVNYSFLENATGRPKEELGYASA